MYTISILLRMENIRQMGYLHPDGDLPPKADWLDDKRIKSWEKQCDNMRKQNSEW